MEVIRGGGGGIKKSKKRRRKRERDPKTQQGPHRFEKTVQTVSGGRQGGGWGGEWLSPEVVENNEQGAPVLQESSWGIAGKLLA